jgi:SpoIID/LytB domain protein
MAGPDRAGDAGVPLATGDAGISTIAQPPHQNLLAVPPPAHRTGPRRSRRLPAAVAALGAILLATQATTIQAGGGVAAQDGHAGSVLGTASAAAGPTPVAGSVTFHGRGYGHGVGLSQYGARGRALAGQSASVILAHYYRDTALGPIDRAAQIRVLVLWNWSASATVPLVVRGRSGTWTVDGIATIFPADAVLRLVPTVAGSSVTWRLSVTSATGTVLHDAASSGSFRIRPAATATTLQLDTKPSTYDRYRGVLRVIGGTTVPTVRVVNELPLEVYLRGVVPAEMPSTWPVAALRAQAIVARGYAARKLRPGVSHYDVTDDTSSQVYRGVLGEKAATDAAISATAGRVLMKGTEIALTVFHSTAGGATEHNENAFVSASGAKTSSPVPYLRGNPDRDPTGRPYDADAPYATWKTATYTVAQLSGYFGADSRTAVGTLTALDLRNRGVSGRLISVTLIGTGGQKTVSGDVFRQVFNAESPLADPAMRSNLVALQPIP